MDFPWEAELSTTKLSLAIKDTKTDQDYIIQVCFGCSKGGEMGGHVVSERGGGLGLRNF